MLTTDKDIRKSKHNWREVYHHHLRITFKVEGELMKANNRKLAERKCPKDKEDCSMAKTELEKNMEHPGKEEWQFNKEQK